MRMQLFFRLLSLFLFLLVAQGSRAQSTPTTRPAEMAAEFVVLRNCDKLFKTAKSSEELAELQKDYWMLLGIVQQLYFYRQNFLNEGNLIDLFPTAYYHTTLNELSRLNQNEYKHPIEKMRQMIAFFDAYEYNRQNWNTKNILQVDSHWQSHFEMAEFWNTDFYLTAGLKDAIGLHGHSAIAVTHVLASAVRAHVQYDLPRAIRYAYNNRFNRQLTFDSLKTDFYASNILFGATTNKTVQDINSIHTDWGITLGTTFNDAMTRLRDAHRMADGERFAFIISNMQSALIEMNLLVVPGGVEEVRERAWEMAEITSPDEFQDYDGITKMPRQPILPASNHEIYITDGKKICPPEPIAHLRTSTPLPTDLLGASSPEELGKILFQALKTNDTKLWNQHYHPSVDLSPQLTYCREVSIIRRTTTPSGLVDWGSAKFKRVTYNKGLEGRDTSEPDYYSHQVEYWLNHYTIEFTCDKSDTMGKGYVGCLTGLVICTYQGQRYFVRGAGVNIDFKRSE